MVQMRWGHLNRDHSLLTTVQSLFLDGHLLLEQTARSRSGRFFNFNGTAGIWRKSCIRDSGGWQHDTLTEDLDLSYRAQMKGWRFVYLPDIVVPGELPVDINGSSPSSIGGRRDRSRPARNFFPGFGVRGSHCLSSLRRRLI